MRAKGTGQAERTLMFLRVTRSTRGSEAAVTQWNSAWPRRSSACSVSCVAGSSAIGDVSTTAVSPPYGPTHLQGQRLHRRSSTAADGASQVVGGRGEVWVWVWVWSSRTARGRSAC